MHVNRTGAGFHRDSRREARMDRSAAKRWAIEESELALDLEEEAEGPKGLLVGPPANSVGQPRA